MFILGWGQEEGQLGLVGSWEIGGAAGKESERVQRASTWAVIFRLHRTGNILEMHILRPHSHMLKLKLRGARPSQLLHHALQMTGITVKLETHHTAGSSTRFSQTPPPRLGMGQFFVHKALESRKSDLDLTWQGGDVKKRKCHCSTGYTPCLWTSGFHP